MSGGRNTEEKNSPYVGGMGWITGNSKESQTSHRENETSGEGLQEVYGREPGDAVMPGEAEILHYVTDMGNGAAYCSSCGHGLNNGNPLKKIGPRCPKCFAKFTDERYA